MCYHHSDCRNLTAEAEYEQQRAIYANSSEYNTTLPELKIYECCDANATYSNDYSVGSFDEDYEEDEVVTPGRCCIKEPMPLWLAILILVILGLIVAGCCFLCCFVRPRLDAVFRQYQRPHLTHDTVQTMAALKILSEGTGTTNTGVGGAGSNLMGSRPTAVPGKSK